MHPSYKVILIGSSGRMGKILTKHIDLSPDFSIKHTIDNNSQLIPEAFQNGDVVIDFSVPEATKAALPIASKCQIPYLCGVTGFTEDIEDIFFSFSNTIPILYSANMSYGIAIIKQAVRKISKNFPTPYQITIRDHHHKNKKDSPSGTSKTFGKILENNRQTIEYQSIRSGDIVGQHTILFTNKYEKIEIIHTANTRDVFAKGALDSAKWLIKQPPGLHTFDKMFDLC